MDNQFLRTKLENRIAQLLSKQDDDLINLGKTLGAREELESMLDALNELEGVGDEPTPIEGDLLDASPQQTDDGYSETAGDESAETKSSN